MGFILFGEDGRKMNWSDFGERNKRLNPLWNLGAGMNLGEIQPYKEMVSLSILLQVYYLELESNERRSKEDIITLAWTALERFNIANLGTTESVGRLVEGLLWSGTSNPIIMMMRPGKCPCRNISISRWTRMRPAAVGKRVAERSIASPNTQWSSFL